MTLDSSVFFFSPDLNFSSEKEGSHICVTGLQLNKMTPTANLRVPFGVWLLSISGTDIQPGFYINATGTCPCAARGCTVHCALQMLTPCHLKCCVLCTHFHDLAVCKPDCHPKAMTGMALSTASLTIVSSFKVWGTAGIQRLAWIVLKFSL